MDFNFFFDYLYLFNQVSFDQPRETNIEVVYETFGIYLCAYF